MAMMIWHDIIEAHRINHERLKKDRRDGKTVAHDDPISVLLEPGKSSEIIRKFTMPMEL